MENTEGSGVLDTLDSSLQTLHGWRENTIKGRHPQCLGSIKLIHAKALEGETAESTTRATDAD
jgi:hypothetical protein